MNNRFNSTNDHGDCDDDGDEMPVQHGGSGSTSLIVSLGKSVFVSRASNRVSLFLDYTKARDDQSGTRDRLVTRISENTGLIRLC